MYGQKIKLIIYWETNNPNIFTSMSVLQSNNMFFMVILQIHVV